MEINLFSNPVVKKHFCTAGPIIESDNYFIPSLSRIDLQDVVDLIINKKYFVLHAPRQTGKTSLLLSLRDYINESGNFYCVYVNIEAGQATRNDVDKVIKGVVSSIARRAKETLGDDYPETIADEVLSKNITNDALTLFLSRYCQYLDKPLILLIDEIDAIVGDSLIAILRQIRAGYDNRPKAFPQSIVLCGLRDVQDYRMNTEGQQAFAGGSPFNIKVESLRLGDFTEADVRNLLEQHTTETGQRFEEDCFPLIWEYTEGQPWLVNALAYEVTYKMKENRDPSVTITADMCAKAKNRLIVSRQTHLGYLTEKLKEERIARIIAPMLSGEPSVEEDEEERNADIAYATDLGLVKIKPLRIANAIYREVIPRELTWGKQQYMMLEPLWYVNEDNSLNMQKLMTEFQQFYRQNSDWWHKDFRYIESGPQLLIQAFLQRIINGGAYVDREYGLGSGRTDLFIRKPLTDGFGGPNQYIAIELKVRRRDSREKCIQKGIEQTCAYIDKAGKDAEGHLLIFESDKTIPWDERIYYRKEVHNGQTIHVWGA